MIAGNLILEIPRTGTIAMPQLTFFQEDITLVN